MTPHDTTNSKNEQQFLEPRQLYLFDIFDNDLSNTSDLKLLDTNNIKPETIRVVADAILNCFDDKTNETIRYRPKYGRPGLNLYNALCFTIFMSLFNFNTVRKAAQLLNKSDEFKFAMDIPYNTPVSEYTISKLTKQLYTLIDIEEAFTTYYMKNKNNDIIFCSSVDSTIYQAYEKAPDEKTWKQYEIEQQKLANEEKNEPKKKRGRPRKGSVAEIEGKRNRANQKRKDINALIKALQNDYEGLTKNLNKNSAWTVKTNSQGRKQFYRGYKLHLMTDDYGAVCSYIITGANVHDSRVSIPLKVKCPIPYLYSVEDKGYDSQKIRDYATMTGHKAVIDSKFTKNMSHMDEFEKNLYRNRTSVERTNSEFKSCFLPKDLAFKGNRLKFQMGIALFLYNMKRLKETKRQILEARELSSIKQAA